MAPSIELRNINPNIWNACAGLSTQIPTVDSRVYYFPQGHAEHSSSTPDFSSLIFTKPFVLSRVSSLRLLSNPDTDEVFAMIRLEPIDPSLRVSNRESSSCLDDEICENDEKKIVSFAKILTPSDANNGGGFSVPRFCADSIFPPLNYEADPPVQTISVRDVQGMVWEFRHIFRGTPRRHLLTTGWSKFVNHKKLVAGDSVVFMKNRSGELFVGIRRAVRASSNGDCGRWSYQIMGGVKSDEELGNGEGFSRSRKGKISAESVVQAAELAGVGRAFEIVYYPNAGSPDFVLKAEKVEDALSIHWTAGMRFKLSLESEDSSRMTCFYGTVSNTVVPDHGLWRGSPWGMLQVTWDDSEVLKNVKRVSPWQVELVDATPLLQTPFPPMKKLRAPNNPELLTDVGGAPFFPMIELTKSMMGHLSPSFFGSNSFPAGMQGARHDAICLSSYSNFLTNATCQMYSDHLRGGMAPPFSSVSTELNIGGTSPIDNSSPHSHSSVNSFGKEVFGNQTCKSMTKAGSGSIQLFGKIIQTNQIVAVGLANGGCIVDDGSEEDAETEGLINLLDPSLSSPYKKMYNMLDVQCQRISAVEACTL